MGSLAFTLVGKAVEPLLHFRQLAFQIVDLAGRSLGALAFARGPRGRGRRAEPGKHGKRALEHFHVAADLVFHRAEAAAESLCHLLAELFLLARERLDRSLEEARNQHLHAIAVEADELAQEDRKSTRLNSSH